MDHGLVSRRPDSAGYGAGLAKNPGPGPFHYGPVLRLVVPWLVLFPVRILAVMLLFASTAQATCPLDEARWAYDEENRILRLCVKIQGSEQMRCTTFPQPVVIDPFSL